MAERTRDRLQINSRRKYERSKGVTQIVESDVR